MLEMWWSYGGVESHQWSSATVSRMPAGRSAVHMQASPELMNGPFRSEYCSSIAIVPLVQSRSYVPRRPHVTQRKATDAQNDSDNNAEYCSEKSFIREPVGKEKEQCR